ncbi:MAG TPA: hypothetical protein VFQ05_09260 [Candidatus Eisenbacteria bacterium]|nr:hypothetical protein [Candidatus Eisenbacteria bacterium]
MSRRSWYAVLILASSLTVHRPALAQYSGTGPSGGTTCRPATPEAGSLNGTGIPRIGWPGVRGLFESGFRRSPRLSLQEGALPFFVRRRAGA